MYYIGKTRTHTNTQTQLQGVCCCNLSSYRTKLKAAKAMKYTNMEAIDNQRGGPVVPGTNKYTMEG